VVSSLKAIANTNETTKLGNQLNTTQTITQANIEAFADIFSDTIKNTLEGYDEQIKNFGETDMGRRTFLNKSHLCLQLMSLPAWNSRLGLERCLNLKMVSQFSDGPQSVAFSKSIFSMPFQNRVCLYRNFVKKDQLFQLLRDRQRDFLRPKAGPLK
jgi:hypothetical protein